MTTEDSIESMLIQMFAQAHAQFGNAIKAYWFYDPDPCPGCGHKVGAMRHKGQEAVSLNGYIYRKRGVLIGYFLCDRCANEIHRSAKRRPRVQTRRHDTIEANLGRAYEAHMNSMDA
ncbi:MAG: hypothetical protein GY805_00550 [Chloroflexi bacterium]|nr:hypothetical protein [Chloroflexota bacterium]